VLERETSGTVLFKVKRLAVWEVAWRDRKHPPSKTSSIGESVNIITKLGFFVFLKAFLFLSLALRFL
jgi:hypothetical protein